MPKPTQYHISSLTIKQQHQVISLPIFKNLPFALSHFSPWYLPLSKSSKSVSLSCWLVHYNCPAHMQMDLLWMWSNSQSLCKHLTVQVHCIRFADKWGTSQHTWWQGCCSAGPGQAGEQTERNLIKFSRISLLHRKEEPLVLYSWHCSAKEQLCWKMPQGSWQAEAKTRDRSMTWKQVGCNSTLSCITMNRGQQTESTPIILALQCLWNTSPSIPPPDHIQYREGTDKQNYFGEGTPS